MENKISIIIPVYNSAKFLPKCLESVFLQTYQNFEVILVCDKSTDNSEELCKEYAKKYPFVKAIIRQNKKGVSSARNTGIENIPQDCDFVSFIDADDWLEPNYYEVLLNNMLKTQSDVSICNWKWEKPNNRHIHNKNYDFEILDKTEMMKELFLSNKFNGALWNKLIKKDLAKNLKFDETISYGEDLSFSFQYLKRCSQAVYTSAKLYHYIKNKNGITAGGFSEKKLSILPMMKGVIADCDNNLSEITPYAQALHFLHAIEVLFFFKLAKQKNPQTKSYVEDVIRKNYKPYLKVRKEFDSFRKLGHIAGKILVKKLRK